MKKITLVCAVVLASLSVKAQGFYGDISVGYGLGLPSTNFSTNQYVDNANNNNSYNENIYGTLGGGINVALTPGYFFNDNIGVELGLQGFFGSNTTVSEYKTNDVNEYSWTKARSNQFRVIPSLVISSGNSKKFSVYAKAGLVLPVLGATYGTQEVNSANALLGVISGGQVTHMKREIETVTKGNVSLGFRGAVGVNFKISDKISIFGEVQHTSLTIKPKTRTVNSYKANGTDIVNEAYMINGINVSASGNFLGNTTGTLDVSDREVEYVDKLTNTSNAPGNANFDDNKATQALPSKTNFNQLGINIGVKFNF